MAVKSKATNGRHTGNGTSGSENDPEAVVIPRLKILRLRLVVRGITPLVICRWDDKVKADMEAKTEGKAANKKAPKDPEAEWNAARHLSTEGWDGVHAGGIRAAIIDAARSVEGLTMTALKQAIFIRADGMCPKGTPLVRIDGKPEKFTTMCRTTTGVAYPRHRPIYKKWSLTLNLEVNEHLVSRDAAVNLISLAGFTCGLGEWRPTSPKSRTGDMGRFEIATDD